MPNPLASFFRIRHRNANSQIALLLAALVLGSCALVGCRSETPAPTVAATVEATPAATNLVPITQPTPLPSIDVASLVDDAPLPANVSPFTGLSVADPALLQRMPAAIKISNSPIARPQSGLSKADVVIEHLAEGGITRFTAIYHSQNAERIGSIRSARLIDLEIAVLFDAYLVYSGANGEVMRLIDASDFYDRTVSDERKDPAFYRLDIPGRAYEHTLFTDSELMQQYAVDKGWTTPPRHRGWQWSDRPAGPSQPASSFSIPYSADYCDVDYVFDVETGLYRRSVLHEPHIDDLTGEQLTAANVVVLYVNHVPTLIVEDMLGSKSLEIQLWGEGRLQLFRDGVVQEGSWLRPQREDPLLFVDSAGQSLPLKRGAVWIEIVPLEMMIPVGVK